MSLGTFYATFGDLNVSGRSDGQNAVENIITDVAHLNFSAVPSGSIKCSNFLSMKAGGWALDHPVTSLVIPPAPFVVAGVTQAKEAGSKCCRASEEHPFLNQQFI